METQKVKGLRAKAISFFLFLTVCGFSQATFKRSEIKEFRYINDICNCLPDNAVQVSYEILGKVAGKEGVYKGQGDTLNAGSRLLMNTADPGSKIYMDIKCATKSSPALKMITFSFKVEK